MYVVHSSDPSSDIHTNDCDENHKKNHVNLWKLNGHWCRTVWFLSWACFFPHSGVFGHHFISWNFVNHRKTGVLLDLIPYETCKMVTIYIQTPRMISINFVRVVRPQKCKKKGKLHCRFSHFIWPPFRIIFISYGYNTSSTYSALALIWNKEGNSGV